jgi:hypothetical protein
MAPEETQFITTAITQLTRSVGEIKEAVGRLQGQVTAIFKLQEKMDRTCSDRYPECNKRITSIENFQAVRKAELDSDAKKEEISAINEPKLKLVHVKWLETGVLFTGIVILELVLRIYFGR